MFLTTATLALFLLYFFYITRFPTPRPVPKPAFPYVPTQPLAPTHRLESDGTHFRFTSLTTTAWETPLPEGYTVQQDRIVAVDPCHGQPDGTRLLATGQPLYDHVHRLVPHTSTFERNSERLVRDKRVFYFTCRESKIDALDACPASHAFRNGRCERLSRCSGQPDGTRFADPYDTLSYITCDREQEVSNTCPPDTVFLHDTCVSHLDSALYCQFHTEPRILDPTTLLVCRNERIVYETCPPGFQYIETPVCEADACVGRPDGTLLPLPDEHRGPFAYSPGYSVCRGEKIVETRHCPRDWDPHRSEGEDLTHLPMVFDGKQCAVPTFCTNVTSTDPDVIVPVHEFTKHVQNWSTSSVMDRLVGYACPRQRIVCDPGQRIGSDYKRESACDDTRSKIPVPDRPDRYYDCSNQSLNTCPSGEVFDSDQCRPRIERAFHYNGLDLFRFESLTPLNWMPVVTYDKKSTAKPCDPPESVWMETYNLCSHPECTRYAFLSMMPPSFQVALEDGGACAFRGNRRLQKEPGPRMLYWNQRENVDDLDPCVPGTRVQTGHFVWDSTVYRTCQASQPFVFCPSSSTRGLMWVEHSKYACEPNADVGKIPAHTTHTFEINEVRKILNAEDTPTPVKINGKDQVIPLAGGTIHGRFTLETLDEPVLIQSGYLVTHPPEVVLGERPEVRAEGYGFIMKLKDFTTKPLAFPEYRVSQNALGFAV